MLSSQPTGPASRDVTLGPAGEFPMVYLLGALGEMVPEKAVKILWNETF